MEEEPTSSSEFPLPEDILSSIFSHVPLVHLLPASHVSTSWKFSVSTSLRCFNTLKPWLLVHAQSKRFPHSVTSHAYDPRSHVWIEIRSPPLNLSGDVILRSSTSSFLYTLTHSKFCFSFDSLNLTWHDAEPPRVWRIDPIVAKIGGKIVVAGGGCDFEDDPLAVEIYDLDGRTWKTCESMPEMFHGSASAMWLSIATDNNRMFVTVKKTAITHWLDLNTGTWCGPFHLKRDCMDACCFFIGWVNGRLILIEESTESVKFWEIDTVSLEIERQIGEMPKELLEILKGEDETSSHLTVNLIADFVYFFNGLVPTEVVMCEIGSDKHAFNWRRLKNPMVTETSFLTERFVITSANVGLGDLQRAVVCEKKFFVK